jgi:hypothetical protein
MNSRLVIVLALPFMLAACAHHRDVRAGAQNTHRVVVKSEGGEEGTRDAIEQANHFCDKRYRGRHATFLNEDNKYTGDLDEKTYKNGKRATKVAQVAGGGLWAFGGKGASTLGGIAALGGSAGDAALGKGYTVEMKFKCM